MLFLVAVLEEPTDEDKLPVLKFGPKPVIAKDQKAAGFKVVMEENIEIDPSQMNVLVRPF